VGNDIYYDFEDFRLDVTNEQLLKDSQPIPLTHKAFKTLLILVQNHGQLVKKEDIIRQIWHDSFVEDANLTQHIYVLRKTLGNNKDGKPFIETVPKRGYCFVGEIQKVTQIARVAKPAFAPPLPSEDAVLDEQFLYVRGEDGQIHLSGERRGVSGRAPDETSVQATSALFSKRVLALIGLAGLIVLGLFLWHRFSVPEDTGIKSIAVLPFKPIGEESNNEKVGFGIADAVITSLSKQQKIPVRPTSAVFQFTEKNFNPVDAGRELGVDSVLEGTVQRDGEWIRVSVRLIKIADNSTIWAETFDEKFTYIFAVQDSISTKVAKSLMLNLTNAQEAQLTARNTSNPEAYQAYQLGRYFWNKRSKEDLEKSVTYFRRAIEFDQNYAIAYAMLADAYNMLYYYRYADNLKETIDRADEAAQKALALNDSIPESHIAISFVQLAKYDDVNASIKSLERAIQLSPYNPTARIRYGWQLLRQGNLEGANQQIRIAQENDPLSIVSNSALCTILLLKREFPEAVKYCEKCVEIQPNAPMVRVQLASAYFLNGQPEPAVAILKEEVQNPRNRPDALSGLAYIYAKTGRTKEAEEIYVKLKNDTEFFSHRYSDLALVSHALGKREESLQYFRKMADSGSRIPVSVISDPYWDDILKDEEFKQIAGQFRK
jgi:DNA-binding winged helix-turn-helix (wHTH) protein/TolB-like protein/Tfp pilus assembly protein PilF